MNEIDTKLKGTPWERGLKTPVSAGPKQTGQLWEPCPKCGQEPVYMPLHLCDNCWPKTAPTPRIDTACREPYRRGIGQGFGDTEDGQE